MPTLRQSFKLRKLSTRLLACLSNPCRQLFLLKEHNTLGLSMKQLIGAGLVVAGLIAMLKCVSRVTTPIGGTSHTSLFFIKQAILAAGLASVSMQLYRVQRRNREQNHREMKAK